MLVPFESGFELIRGHPELPKTHLQQEINYFVWNVVVIAIIEGILFLIVALVPKGL